MTENSSVIETLRLNAPSAPERQPDRRALQPQERPDTLAIVEARTETDLFDALRDAAERVVREARPSAGPTAVEVDEQGCFVVQDITGAVYGSGVSREEAFAAFYDALEDRLAFLRENAPALHPRLTRELRILQKLFPGR